MSISEARSPTYFVYRTLFMKALSCGAASSVVAASTAARLLPILIVELRFHALLFARLFLRRCEFALLTAAQLAMRHQSFQQEFRTGNHLLGTIGRFYAQRRKLFKQSLNLFQI